MSTPSKEKVEARQAAAAGQRQFVTALGAFLSESEEAVNLLLAAEKRDDGEGRVYAFQAGLINGLVMLLRSQQAEASLQADLWERTGRAMRSEREAEGKDRCFELVEDGTLPNLGPPYDEMPEDERARRFLRCQVKQDAFAAAWADTGDERRAIEAFIAAEPTEAELREMAEKVARLDQVIPETDAATAAYADVLIRGGSLAEARDAARETAA